MFKIAKLLAIAAVSIPAAQPPAPIPDIQLPTQVWESPLKAPIQLINQYRQPNSDYSAGHRGVDYRVAIGEEILAPAAGTIWFAGKVVNRNVLSILTSDGLLAEFEPACTELAKGSPVLSGQAIARVCDAEPSYQEHCQAMRCLHVSLRVNGRYMSPLYPLGQLNPSRLMAERL